MWLCMVSSKAEQYEDFLKQYLKTEYEVSQENWTTNKKGQSIDSKQVLQQAGLLEEYGGN